MVEKYVSDLASKMGVKLSKVHLVEGKTVGCFDAHTLMMASRGCNVGTIIYQINLDNIEKGVVCDQLELRINQALERLRLMLEP